MILPLGPVSNQQDEPPPAIIKDEYAKYWWALALTLGLAAVGRLVAADVFGALISGIVAFIAWYMVRESCARMSQYCVLLFGVCCMMEAIFEFIALATSLPGRRMEHTSRVPMSDSKVTYTTVVETHPFFDPSQGWHYNFQSGMKIMTVLSLIASAALSWTTYSLYPTNLFDDDVGGGGGGYNGRLLGAGASGGGGSYQAFGGSSPSGAGQRLGGGGGGSGGGGRPPAVFEGVGQRLGSG
mmetsp:Transcript_99061/g.288969  ORF Transcript_99061/g.288969 Transcript_99061/m.288969 type:complete len:240 (+) Transcript_99061:96-815(+)